MFDSSLFWKFNDNLFKSLSKLNLRNNKKYSKAMKQRVACFQISKDSF